MDSSSWDDLHRCARFIGRFTSHDLKDGCPLDLGTFSRKDLEGIVQLLYGYYTAAVLDSPPELGEALRCTEEDVVRAMSMASRIDRSDSGEIILDNELWDLTRRNPLLLRYFIELQVL